jgi:hypothetical protein
MSSGKLIGLVLLVGGLIALGFAYQQSGSAIDQTKHFFTGDYRDRTTWMIVAGGIAATLGFVTILSSRRSAA